MKHSVTSISPAQTFAVASGFPRLLLIFDNLYISGAEKVAINLLCHARKRGLPAEGIVHMDDLIGAAGCGANVRAFDGPIGGSFAQRLLRGAGRVPALRKIAGEFDLLVPVTPPAIPWALAAGAASRARVVPWIHYDLDGFALDLFNSGRGVRDFLMNALHTRLAPSFDRLLFASHAARDSFVKANGGAKPGWAVVPNVYDRQPLAQGASACAKALEACRAKGKAALLFAGRICRQKRWDEALRVAEILCLKGFPFELHFAGDGPEMAMLRTAVAANPAQEAIFLHGFDANLISALTKADALLLTSLHEAWPTVILEAFDMGTPVLSYDSPSGPAEMLGRNLERGVLCSGALDMAERICWLLDARQKELRRQMAGMAKRFIEPHLPDHALDIWAQTLRGMM